ncbi:MAG: transglutaminase-like domain-containing protein [Eubacteriales bacterium]
MILVNKMLKNAEKLIFLSSLSICEAYYIMQVLFDMKASFILSVVAVFFIVTLALLISLLPKKIVAAVYISLAVAMGIIIYNFIQPIGEFIISANTALLSKVYIQSDHLFLVLFAAAALLSLVNYIFIFLFKKSILAALASVLLVCIIYFAYDYFNVLFFIIYVAVILMIFLRWTSPIQFDDKSESAPRLVVPFALIIISAIILSPISVVTSNARPAPLQWIDELDWFENDEQATPVRSVRIDGQSKLTDLYNEFNYSDDRMMIVNSPYIERLRNKTYDTYTRNGWERAQKGSEASQGYQYTNDELIAIMDANGIPYTKYQISVELVANSQILFGPINSQITTEFDDTLYRNIYDDIFFSDAKTEGFTYSMDALKIEFASPEFEKLITNSKSENIDNLENYLSITTKMENLLKPLAMGLTKDATNNYEKAKIIESYLASQYTYSLHPPDKPENEDFIEYFLFETKEGFCTHYASSMVMMLRSIGIPCRYVTGYVLDIPAIYEGLPDDIKQQMGIWNGTPEDFNVVKRNSHAWVEVWFDDFGWLTFEPTSKYASSMGYSYNEISNMDFENIELVETQDEAKSYKTLFIILGSVLGAAAIIIAAIRIYYVRKREDREKIAILWNDIKRAYYKHKKIKKQNETAREFYMRSDIKNQDLLSAVTIYEYAVYSDKEISSWQMTKMQRIAKKIRQDIKSHRREIKKLNKEKYKKPEVFNYD